MLKFEDIDFSNAKKIALVNNAGMVEPIKPMDKVSDIEIVKNINVNLTAPLIIASTFLRKTADFTGDKRIITVSSGAGKSPIKGWGSYCVSKCGVDIMTRVIALEPKVVAEVLYKLLHTETDFEQGGIVSVRDFIEND